MASPDHTADGPDLKRLTIDVALQVGLGRFFAEKLRAGVLYALYKRVGDREALKQALKAYRAAREAWTECAQSANVYDEDLTFGLATHLRGHWTDRLPAIEADIADMERTLEEAASSPPTASSTGLIAACQTKPPPRCRHSPPASFRPGEPVRVDLILTASGQPNTIASARLHYRHVNQAESYDSLQMDKSASGFSAWIPGTYTDSPYPLQYFFELRRSAAQAWFHPGINLTGFRQPYYVIRRQCPVPTEEERAPAARSPREQ
jgi:hypothetical protein